MLPAPPRGGCSVNGESLQLFRTLWKIEYSTSRARGASVINLEPAKPKYYHLRCSSNYATLLSRCAIILQSDRSGNGTKQYDRSVVLCGHGTRRHPLGHRAY